MTAVNVSVNTTEEVTFSEKVYEKKTSEVLSLEEQENELELVKELRASEEWEEVPSYDYLTPSGLSHSLTATTLRGEGMIARPPLQFFNKDKTKCVLAMHLGTNLCGHDGIIHGGLAATILDEMLAYATVPSLPNYTGFTANLNINYRKPIISNRWVTVHGDLEKVEGRKAWGKAWIQSVEETPAILTEATALYISPRTPPSAEK
ncbi:hypothetical protein K501DRAFT_321570 [Backusella circina FSU 941]|nr:hypothetical protein K501DRAFT_321570 [Backusella circina FSU 941]